MNIDFRKTHWKVQYWKGLTVSLILRIKLEKGEASLTYLGINSNIAHKKLNQWVHTNINELKDGVYWLGFKDNVISSRKVC